MFDRTDNPYMPRSQQNTRLVLNPNDLALLRPFPAFYPSAQTPAMFVVGPMVDQGEAAYVVDDIDDNTSELVPLEEYEFPTYFRQIGSPPRLFHSHGSSYVLPVDSNETKVCCKPVRAQT